jgi:hypothetical protein
MSIGEQKFIRLFDAEGNWISRPDFMVLAVLSETEQKSMDHTYATMILEEEINPPSTQASLSASAIRLKKNVIEKNIKARVQTGEIVCELARISAATMKPPSINAARRLVTHNHHALFGTGVMASTGREVEKSFAQFRDTAHLQAVTVIEPSLASELEGNLEACLRFLGLAKAFQDFIDANVVSTSFKWSPYRIPTQINSVTTIKFKSLSDRELKLLNPNR